jgi:16S rRNA A1518/A1519 N6-dimethyltransferase RsmA/KsgA/DIM1 with predicted DNA glycosylase/AP lyase activity
MKTKLCHAIKDLAFPISLSQKGRDNFTVVYGKQVAERLTYAQAAEEYGRSIMHALACDGKLDNRVKGERY